MKKESAVKTVAKKTVEKAAAAEKAVEKVAEKAAPAVKTTAKKAATATKTAAAKTTKAAAAKKPAAKKPAAKKATVTAVLQYAGKEVSYDELVAKARGAWNGEAIQELALYVKPEEEKVYMVVNGQEAGSFDL